MPAALAAAQAEPSPDADIPRLERQVADNSADTSAALELGRLYRDAGRTDAAEKLYLAILERDPACAECHNAFGFLCERNRDYDRAIGHYRKALEARPGWARPLYHIGTCRLDQGDAAEAERALKEAVAADPADASIHNALGIASARLGKDDAAEAEYRAAAAIRPDWIAPQWNLAILCDQQGRYRESDRALARVLEIDPEHFDALYKRVQHLVGALEYGMAEKFARRLVAAHPDKAASHEALGMVLWSRKDLVEAEGCFNDAIGLDEKSAGAWLGLGHVRLAQRRYAEAERNYRKAVELAPDALDAKRGVEMASQQQQRGELGGGGCASAPKFAKTSPLSMLQYAAVLLPPLLFRRRRH